MTKVKDNYTINDILSILSKYIDGDVSIVEKAYKYILDYCDKSDIKKALNVSVILTSVNADIETISAYILYCLFFNNESKRKEIEEIFGINISKLSYNIYKLAKITLSTENDYLIEYYKKVIVGMTEDVRVIIASLAERVYLMRILSSYEESERKKIAKETKEIFAPLAHHLGIYKLKSELEDLSLRYLKPDVYYSIVEKLNSTKQERDNIIDAMMKEVNNLLKEHNIVHEIKGRSKSIYSIYNKLDKGRKFSDIYDLLALRILVRDEQECYLVLGLIHSKFKPIAKRFKDFIAMPKSNGYQSLHTTVFGTNNELFEIQIRTYEMNDIAENGIAAHWSYKENKNAFNLSKTDAKLEFFKAIIDMSNQNINNNDIHSSIGEDNLDDNLYVFTPKGDVIELPKGSTPVDFAYKVHTKIGDTMVGALVNNQIVPLNYQLQDGDVIKINTSNLSTGPKEDWLSFVKLTRTKNKIKGFFTRERKDEYISLGREMLKEELRKRKISNTDFQNEYEKKILKLLHLKDLENLYNEIGSNKLTAKYVIDSISKEKEEEVVVNKNILKQEFDINVSGYKDIKVNIASCCLPVPHEEIVGYITKNNGITIHRKNCSNLIHLEDRMVDVCFNETTKGKYLTNILVTLKNNQNKLGDILNKIGNRNLSIDSVKTYNEDNVTSYKISLYVMNLEILERLINDLVKLRYVKEVERI